MLIQHTVLTAINADPELRQSEHRLNLALIVGSAVHHTKNLVGGTTFSYRLLKSRTTDTSLIEFPTRQTVRLRIRLASLSRVFEVLVRLPRPGTRTEQLVLSAISAAHCAAADGLICGASILHGDLTETFLEKMDDIIIDTALSLIVEDYWSPQSATDRLADVRRFVQSLLAATYEGRPPEIGVSMTQAKSISTNKRVNIRELLESKKTSTLFSGYRQLLICDLNANMQRQITLPPYSDVPPMARGSVQYPAPFEYQPVMRFSHQRNAVTFLLTRRREVFVIFGPEILFMRDGRGWRIFALERFLTLLSELLRQNSKKSLTKRNSEVLAVYLAMLCLSLRERGKGALFVINRRGVKPSQAHSELLPAEKFFQSLFANGSIFDIPVSLMCNAAAVDGASILSWDCMVKRFGVIVNTERLKSASEGARTRAAEFTSRHAVSIKVSEDGEITLFNKGKALVTVG